MDGFVIAFAFAVVILVLAIVFKCKIPWLKDQISSCSTEFYI